jgi:hypothetical protein
MKNILIIELVLLGSILFPCFTTQATVIDTGINFHLPISGGVLPKNEDKPYYESGKKLIKEMAGEVSAYTLGRVEENDSDPCIGASNVDMCVLAKQGKLMFANNYYKLGTIVCIDTVGCGEVMDRMNERYGQQHFDVAGLDLKKNKEFGRQNLVVRVYKK